MVRNKWDFPPATKKMVDAVNKEVEEEHQRLKLPKLTKKVARKIDENHKRFLKKRGKKWLFTSGIRKTIGQSD